MEVLFHEYFVGYFINKYNNPSFAKVIGLFGCSADDCEYKGKSNFILYQYIKGPTMFDALDKKIITSTEAFYLINLVYEGLKEMYELTGFIHQDLHLSNIILQPLDDWYNININGIMFTIRYLPKIIDYGRAQILYNKRHQFSQKLIHMLPAKSLNYDLAYLISLYDVYNPDIFDDLGIKSENNVHYLTNYDSSIITKLWMTLSDHYRGSFIPPVSVKWIEEEPFILNLDYQKCPNKRDVPDNLIDKYDERLHYLKMEREFNKTISKIVYSRNNIIYIIDMYFKYNFPISKSRYEEILAIIYYSLNRRGARFLSGGPDDNRIIEEYLLNYKDNYTPQISEKIKEFIENYRYS